MVANFRGCAALLGAATAGVRLVMRRLDGSLVAGGRRFVITGTAATAAAAADHDVTVLGTGWSSHSRNGW